MEQLRDGCKTVKESTKLQALFQVVLDVGNALNAGTAKGNAVGFRLGTLLKLAELKAQDKKTTLLHFTAEVYTPPFQQQPSQLHFTAVAGLVPAPDPSSVAKLFATTLSQLSFSAAAFAFLLSFSHPHVRPLSHPPTNHRFRMPPDRLVTFACCA